MEVITTHLNADFDALASMVAAQKLYPQALMVFSGSQEKNLRDFVSQSMQMYKFHRQKHVDLAKIRRLIVVDTRQPSRIGNFAQCLDNPRIEIHLYDHHPDAPGDIKGDIEVIRQTGSTATIFTKIFQTRKFAVTPEEATILAMAIYEDTGSFIFETTTPDDLIAAAWLLKKGANLHTVGQFISHELTAPQINLLHDLIKSATTYTFQGIDIIVAKLTLPEYIDEFALIVRRYMSMENLDTLMTLVSMGERIYLICRSRIPEVNVGEIALEFGGGGHASAASATIKDMTLVQAEENLITLLQKHVRPPNIAGEIMSYPVIHTTPDVSIDMADQTLNRYNITVLPLVNDKKEIVGIISRRVVSKSIHHGLGNLPVSEFMTTDFITLPPEAHLSDIQELIIENRQRFIPVVSDGEIKGVITRTDLLNLLVNDPAHLPKNLLDVNKQPSSERNRNLNNLMVEHLSRDIIILLKTIGEVAEANGFRAYTVGGFVRDMLLRQANLDLDIVVEGNGIDFAKKLAAKLGGEVRTHEKFNTAMVKLPNNPKLDIATARLEYYDHPAAMPIVELSSIKLDLYRRDFTINAMAVHLNPDTFGTLVDFFNCQNDLKDRKIRILHNLSFVEDPTRIFRAIRFEQRMGFAIGSHTERLIKSAVKMNLFNCIPTRRRRVIPGNSKKGRTKFGYRFFIELKLILSEEFPVPAIKRMGQFDLLKFLHSKINLEPRLLQILEETEQAVAWHRLLFHDESCCQWLVFLLALTAKLSGEEMMSFCRRFEVPERYIQILKKTKTTTNHIARSLKRKSKLKTSETYYLLRELNIEGLLFLMGVTKETAGKKAVSKYVTNLRQTKTITNGAALKKMGFESGPIFRTILDRLLAARLDNEVETRAEELAFINQHYPLSKFGRQQKKK